MAWRSPPLTTLWVVATSIVLTASSCLIEVPKIKACGDGYIDFNAGEACDPAADEATMTLLAEQACLENSQAPGRAVCDPESCQFIATADECAVCGDGLTQGPEDCDGTAPLIKCPDGITTPNCNVATCQADFSNCPTCGNGLLDEDMNEECDPVILPGPDGEEGGNGLVQVVACRDLEVLADLPSSKSQPNEPPGRITYTRGEVALDRCANNVCQLVRKPCNFCGDGELDEQHTDRPGDQIIGGSFIRPGERCEIGVHSEFMSQRCNTWCGANDDELEVSCNYECNFDCTDGQLMFEGDWEGATPDDLGCCLVKGERCNPEGPDGIMQQFPCCKGLEPDAEGNGCDGQKFDATNNVLVNVCG